MKKIFFIALVILLPLALTAQINLDHLMVEKAPNCEDIAHNSSHLIIRYYEQNKPDSIEMVLNYWQERCGKSEPIMRTKILMAIENRSFSEALYDSTITGYLLNYAFRMETARPDLAYAYNKLYLGYVPIKGKFDNFTVALANKLLPLTQENTTEWLLCSFYADVTANPIQIIQNSNHYSNSMLYRYYFNEVDKYRFKPDAMYSIYSGVWIPTGNASLLGNHPLIGFQVGMRYKKTLFAANMDFKFINSPNPYLVIRDGELEPESTKHFFGGYIGGNIEQELFRLNKKNQFDLLAGIAFDGFDAIATNTNDNNPENDKGKSINSLNLNVGAGYKYFFTRNLFLAVQGKYNFVNYKNPGGTNLSGNTFTLTIAMGGFTNHIKDYNLRSLRYRQY